MPEIDYLPAVRKPHQKAHFALRGDLEIGRQWWLVRADDAPPKLVGPEENLPGYAQRELAMLRARPTIRQRRLARHIDAHLCFFPGQRENGIPHRQNVEWLRQYTKARGGEYNVEKAYLVVLEYPRNEDYPLQIWEEAKSRPRVGPNHLNARYHLVWIREEEN